MGDFPTNFVPKSRGGAPVSGPSSPLTTTLDPGEIRSNEPENIGEKIAFTVGRVLRDSPVGSRVGSFISGVASAPAVKAVGFGLGAALTRRPEVGEDVSEFLTTFSDRTRQPPRVVSQGPGIVSSVLGSETVQGGARAAGNLLGHAGIDVSGDEFEDFFRILSDRTRNPPTGFDTEPWRLAGGFLPEALAFGTSFWLGGAAATRALAAVNNPVAKQLVGQVGGRIAKQSAAIDRYFQSLADPLLAAAPKPALVRATEILGSSIGTGAAAGAETPFLEHNPGDPPPPSPLARAVETAALTFGIEAGFTVGAKLISRGAREIDKTAIASAFPGSNAQKVLAQTERDFQKKLLKMADKADEAIDAELLELEMSNLAPVPPASIGALTGRRTERGIIRQFGRAKARGLREAKAARIEAVRRVHQANGNLNVARRFANITEEDVLAGSYLSSKPTEFDSTFGAIRKFIREKFGTPDNIRKELGVAGEFSLRSLDNAMLLATGRGNSSLEILLRIRTNIESKLGEQGARNILFDWEKGTEGEVLARLAPQDQQFVARNLDMLGRGMQNLHEVLVQFGAEPAIEAGELGVRRYFPHILRQLKLSDKQLADRLEKHLVADGMSPAKATRRALDVIESRRVRGYQHFGSIDERRKIPGDLRSKLDNGLPFIDDPWDALGTYFLGTHSRIATSQVLGFRNEMVDPLVQAVKAEAGPGAASLFRTTVDSVAGLKYYDRLSESFAATATNLQVAAKMGFSWVPNGFQPGLNNPIAFGLRNTLTGMKQVAASEAPKDLVDAFGFLASDFFDQGLRSHMIHDTRTNVSAKLARFVLSKATPFNFEERYIRLGSGLSGHAAMTDILLRAADGKLRGPALARGRKLFEEAGLDLSTVLRNGISEEEYITSTLRLGRRTAFSAGEATRAIRPPFFQSPLGRIMFQFHTFSLNQGRLLRDFVFNEVAKGDRRALARFLAIYLPTADVGVNVQNAVLNTVTGSNRQRPDDPMIRVLEDMIFSASFGLANTMFYVSQFGRAERVLGATLTDFFATASDVLTGRFDKSMERMLRQPSVLLFSGAANMAYRGGSELREISRVWQDARARQTVERPGRPDQDERGGGDELLLRDFRPAPR